MTDLATLQSELEALKTAYRTGATSISYEGKAITYKSGDEMRIAIANLEAEIAGGPAVRSFVVRSSKGW